MDRASSALGREGLRGIRRSLVYETEPVGGRKQRPYLNAVVEVETSLSPHDLMQRLLAIEKRLGRVRKKKNAPRVIDLDLLFYGHKRIKAPGLTVPHPRLHQRFFVLKPLSDLAPDFRHPVLKKTVAQMLRDLT